VKSLDVSGPAKADIAAIRRYSRRTWGREQAERYVGEIIARIGWLMLNASRGSRQDHILPGLRRINVRRHAIFYRDLSETIEIARILHQQMDHAGQFAAWRLGRDRAD
jgi:toxin ParE1/3/4